MKKTNGGVSRYRFEKVVQGFVTFAEEGGSDVHAKQELADFQIASIRQLIAEQQARQVFAKEAARVLRIARKAHRKNDGLFDDLVNALSLMLEQRPPESDEIEAKGDVASGWAEAFDVAQRIVEIKIDELPLDSHTPATTKALNQVWAVFSQAENRFDTFDAPETLNRYKRRAAPRTAHGPRERLTMPKAILAALPTVGNVAFRKDIEQMLLDKKLTHSRSSASKEIKKLIVKGQLWEHRQPGGRLLERAL